MTSALLAAAGLLFKATVLLGLGGLTALLWRRRAADARHAAWAATILGLVALPILVIALPAWRAPLPEVFSEFSGAWPAEIRTPRIAGSNGLPELRARSESPGPSSRSTTAARSAGVSPAGIAAAGLIGLWAAGTLTVLILVGLGQREMRRSVARARVPRTPQWREDAARAARAMGVARRVRVLEGSEVAVPITWGLRPVVLLPSAAAAWSAARRRAVLLHEFAHVARFDCVIEYFTWVACALYWFHPGVWFAARRLRAERERACDDLVVSAGTTPGEYATHLVDVAAGLAAPRRPGLAALAMASHGSLESRLIDLLDQTRSRRQLGRRTRALLGVAALALVAGVAAARPSQTGATPVSARPVVADTVRRDIAPDARVDLSGFVVAGDTVSVRAAMGSIVVDTAAGTGVLSGEVRVTASRRAGPRGFSAETRVSMIRSGSTLAICSVHLANSKPVAPCEVSEDWGRGSVDDNQVDLHVTVPRGIHLKLMTGLGDLRAVSVGGSIRALTGNGQADISGDGGAVVDAFSGRIGYTMLAGEGSTPVVLRVKHGGIDVRFAPGTSATYEATPGRGTVLVDLPGNRSTSTDRSATGRVGSGRRPLIASLEKGDISLGMAP